MFLTREYFELVFMGLALNSHKLNEANCYEVLNRHTTWGSTLQPISIL